MADVPLRCSCGQVTGVARDVSPRGGNHVICHCDDCQAFAHHLGTGNILDAYGGTEIFQMPLARVEITNGQELLRGVRLTAKGLYRWYASCCNTPIGNTMGARLPFIGLVHNFIDQTHRDALGPVFGRVQIKFATQPVPAAQKGASDARVIARMIAKLLLWKVRGLSTPSAFFDETGQPKAEVHILQ